MAPVKIVFSDHTANPPVFVAGSFTDWQAVEVDPTQTEQGYTYEKTFEVAPGTYQYKFRLGSGDWWVCDTQAPRTQDAAGNENNEVVVEPEPVVTASTNETAAAAPANGTSFYSTATQVNGVSKSESADDSQPPPHTMPTADPIKVVEQTPIAKVNGVAKAAPAVEPEKAVEGTNGQTVEPLPVKKQAFVATESSKPQKVIEQPANTNVDGSTSPKPTINGAESKTTSVSSTPPKGMVSDKQENEAEKLGWFSRVFLCGSSRK